MGLKRKDRQLDFVMNSYAPYMGLKSEDGKILYKEIVKVDNTIFDNYIRKKNNMLSLAQSKL